MFATIRRRWLVMLAVLGYFAAFVHAGVVNNALTHDDHRAIEQNPLTERPLDVVAHFTSGFWGPQYTEHDAAWRPLTTLTLAWNRALHGVDPVGYHVVNLLLHWLVVFVVGLYAFRLGLGERDALIAAALFAVHPVHTDAILTGVGRADLLFGLFGLVALYLWERRRNRPALIALALALLSKEMAIMLVPVMLWRDWCRGELSLMRSSGPVATAALWIAARFAVLGSLGEVAPGFVHNPLADAGALTRLLTGGEIYLLALRLFVAPVTLLADYSYATIEPIDTPSAAAVVGLLLLLVTVVLTILTGRRAASLSAALALWLVPYLLISHLGPTLPTIFAERLLYLPSAGLCLVVGYGLSRLEARPKIALGVAAGLVVICLLFAVRSFVRVGDWRDDATLYATTAEDAPRNIKALSNAALVLASHRRLDEGIAMIERALAIYDEASLPHMTAASLYITAGDRARAAEHLARTVGLDSDTAYLTATRCAFAARFTPEVALPPCIAATQAPLAKPDAWMLLAIAYDRVDMPQEADDTFRKALHKAGAPTIDLVFNYGVFLARRRQFDQARTMLRLAKELAPQRADIDALIKKVERDQRGE